jgi:hypothetical protein
MCGLWVVSWQNCSAESRSCAAPIVVSLYIAMHQLRIIIDLLGTPKESDIQSIENPKFREMIRSVAIRPPKKLTKLFPNQNEQGSIDL